MAQKLVLKRVMDDIRAGQMSKKFIDRSFVHHLITEDTDGYDVNGNLLFRYRKNAIPIDLLKSGVNAFKDSIQLTDGRGAASGSSHKRIRKDGTTSNITVGNKVMSGNVGYMDAGAMVHYCRKTAFARQYFEKFKAGIPFVEFIDQLYKELCPVHYAKQKAIADGTDINYKIGDTSFTTVTVNRNFQTAVHKDSGDYQEGFGNLIVYREGHYEGSFFTLLEWGVAVDMHNGDILFADVHKWHGNTPFENCSEDYMRIAFVMYYREYMYLCKKPSEELANIKQKETGYLTL
ncbi:MAG: hypothetical protein V4547_16510 [Bacteroidota bacterium]